MSLSEIERNYFVAAAGGAAPGEPLESLKRKVFLASVTGASPTTPFNQLERLWLLNYISSNGGTITGEQFHKIGELWKVAAITAGGSASNYMDENKRTFYLNA